MESVDMSVEVVRATRVVEGKGLITIRVLYPRFLHMETLTHRRFARNAGSSRAMRPSSMLKLGYYTPPEFHKTAGKGMQSSNELLDDQEEARRIWAEFMDVTEVYLNRLHNLGMGKEECNRILGSHIMIPALITGTEDAWSAFLGLRDHPTADKAMQQFVKMVRKAIETCTWISSDQHLPFYDEAVDGDLSADQLFKILTARYARVSFGFAQIKDHADDLRLFENLHTEHHYSPFEHANTWVKEPGLSCLSCREEDTVDYGEVWYGWEPFRVSMEVK